jgi:DivIVA domain-containing protein
VSVPSGGHEGARPIARQAMPLSPDRVRNWEFSRTSLGRRGYNEDDVRLFLARVAEELATADAEKSALRSEVRRLRNYYRERGVDVDGAAGTGTGAGAGTGAGPGPGGRPGAGEGPTLAAINLMSQAQQAADAQVAQAEEYSRRLVQQAREQYEDILRQAAAQATEAAERAGAAYLDSRGDLVEGPEREALERRIAWLRTFAEVTQVQLRSVLEALTREVDKLGDLPDTPEAVATGNARGPTGV